MTGRRHALRLRISVFLPEIDFRRICQHETVRFDLPKSPGGSEDVPEDLSTLTSDLQGIETLCVDSLLGSLPLGGFFEKGRRGRFLSFVGHVVPRGDEFRCEELRLALCEGEDGSTALHEVPNERSRAGEKEMTQDRFARARRQSREPQRHETSDFGVLEISGRNGKGNHEGKSRSKKKIRTANRIEFRHRMFCSSTHDRQDGDGLTGWPRSTITFGKNRS